MDKPRRHGHRRPSISKNGLQILQESLGIAKSTGITNDYSNTVLVAIDFENTSNIKEGFSRSEDSQLGIATLEVGSLDGFCTGQSIISTRNYITGSASYINKASTKFLFGTSNVLKTKDILRQVETQIPKDRTVILIGHAVRNELEILHALSFELPNSVSAIVDTFRVANDVFEFWAGSLSDLLTLLGCPFDRLHSGGNDANFTLRAALLLAAHGCDDHTADTLREISTVPIPNRTLPGPKKKRRRQKWRENTNKYRSKFRTVEEQNEIREQRAVRRAEAERSAVV